MPIEFAAAVENFVRNCGEVAVQVLFDTERPQCRENILKISHDSDVRQRYRVDSVLSGRFRSVGRSRDDNVSFAEVFSRLVRARGSLQVFQSGLRKSTLPEFMVESQKLARLCREAADVLKELVNSPKPLSVKVQADLAKAEIMSVLRDKRVKGKLIGTARGALRLTFKNVWDYHEMWRQGIRPNEKRRNRVDRELQLVVDATTMVWCLSNQGR